MGAILALIHSKAVEHGIDPLLLQAICKVESNLNPWAIRHEPEYRYILSPMEWAMKTGITRDSETLMQKSSLGIAQVMGALARELGHKGHLTELFQADVCLEYACIYLKRQMKRFQKEDQLISSYNAGTPRWDSIEGNWANWKYIEKVQKELKRLREIDAANRASQQDHNNG